MTFLHTTLSTSISSFTSELLCDHCEILFRLLFRAAREEKIVFCTNFTTCFAAPPSYQFWDLDELVEHWTFSQQFVAHNVRSFENAKKYFKRGWRWTTFVIFKIHLFLQKWKISVFNIVISPHEVSRSQTSSLGSPKPKQDRARLEKRAADS